MTNNAPASSSNNSKTTNPKDDNESPSPPRKPMRQMTIDMASGKLSTKKPPNEPMPRDHPRRVQLREVAAETERLLPGLVYTRRDHIRNDGYRVYSETLDASKSSRLAPVQVQVVKSDTLDAALWLGLHRPKPKPIAILNMANARHMGGGWRHGAVAQEESICYRTSLSLTLKPECYPIPDAAVVYSPTVLVIRENELDHGHRMLDCGDPRALPVVSVISAAAVDMRERSATTGRKKYAYPAVRAVMLEKMRIILRTAIRRNHTQIVLGAFGCGVFRHPNVEVARMWKTVLSEAEFSHGWWEDVVFAVLGGAGSNDPGSNYMVFLSELDGLRLG